MSATSPLLLPAARKYYDTLSKNWSEMTVQECRECTIAEPSVFPDMSSIKVEDRTAEGPAGKVPLRIYTPDHGGGAVLPVVLYIHGGAFYTGNNDTHAANAANLAFYAKVIVIAVQYRLAPEAPFPAGVEDCWAAVEWTAANISNLSGSNGFTLLGESAGGNLSAVMSLVAKQKSFAGIKAQVLVSMVADLSRFDTPSYKEFWDDKLGSGVDMQSMRDKYLQGADPRQWKVSPLLAEDLTGLPPTWIVTAEVDTLRDEAETFGEKLQAAGVPVKVQRFKGFCHNAMMDCELFPKEAAGFYTEVGEYVRTVTRV